MHFALANHLGERQAQLGCAHGAGQRDEHPAALVDKAHVALGGVDERRRVEVAIVVLDERPHRTGIFHHSPLYITYEMAL